jgi:pimeloyl-ACP methyl ester carboxylesterase
MRTALLRSVLTAPAALLAVLVCLDSSPAAVVVFKGGFAVKGKLHREGDTIFDPASGQGIPVAKGFFTIDDGPRRIIFSSRSVEEVLENNLDVNPDLVVLTTRFARLHHAKLETITEFIDVGSFDDKHERDVKFSFTPNLLKGPAVARQKVTAITPFAIRVDAQKFAWSAGYLTREFGQEKVKSLLYSHPDLREKEGQADPLKRLRLYRFFKQAGWFDAAEAELDQFLRDAPAQKAKIDEARVDLQEARTAHLLTRIDLAHQSGRHDWARKQIESLPKEGVDDRQRTQARALQAKYETADEALAAARRFLQELAPRVPASDRKAWDEATAAILKELTLDGIGRLETFVKYSRLADKQKQARLTPQQSPAELLALGVTGWLLGDASAESKPDVALKMWRTRKFVLDLQRTPDVHDRKKLIGDYEKSSDAIAFDELAQLISFLPPPEPEEKVDTANPVELETKAGRRRDSVPYVFQAPPEYQPGRSYPTLILLSDGGQKPHQILEKFTDLAADHGFLLAAPDWAGGNFRRPYGYSAEEHAAVLDVLRDLKRRFNVDTDRVFLFGYGEGGNMAWDVGLAHPHLFAGVMPMSGVPRFHGHKYWPNAARLPFYVMGSELAPNDQAKNIRRIFESWVVRGYPGIYVEYKGRGQEWFGGEIPFLFDWMSRQKRSAAMPDTPEFQSHRDTDTEFYWLAGEGISERLLMGTSRFNPLAAAATLQGKILEGNTIHITAKGYKQVSVYLGRGMVDFEKGVNVQLNFNSRMRDRKLTPSLATLLEDFCQRADRRRLYLVRLDLTL